MKIIKSDERGFSAVEIVIAIVVVAVIAAGGWLVYKHDQNSNKKTASQVISQFNTAMQTGNSSEVLSLESTYFQNYIKTQTVSLHKESSSVPVTDNYLTLCKSVGVYCTGQFDTMYLSAATIKTSSYKTTGVQETFTVKTTATSSSGTGSSSSSFNVDVVPNGNSWLVDDVNAGSYNFNATL